MAKEAEARAAAAKLEEQNSAPRSAPAPTKSKKQAKKQAKVVEVRHVKIRTCLNEVVVLVPGRMVGVKMICAYNARER